jgi:exopolysaccharide biosynthesis operon protein EpsL
MYNSHLVRQTAILISGLGCGAVWAQDSLPLTLSASYALQTDDNLFRLPEAVNAQLDRVETIGLSTLGLLFHTTQGLQEIDVDASLVNYQYKNNSGLGYTASNYAAAWNWAVTPRLRGRLSGNQQERPDGGTANPGPNQQSQVSYRVEAEYEIDGPWHVLAGSSKDKVTTKNAVTIGQEFSSSAVDAGIRYDFSSGSFVKVSAKVAEGTYLNDTFPPSSAIDTKFQQSESALNLHWAVSSASTADFNAAAFQRSHPLYVQRDFSGLNWRGSFNWSITAKTALNLAYKYDRAAYATDISNYSDTETLSLGWSWQTSAKTQLGIRQDIAQLGYHGTPLDLPESIRKDTTRDTNLTLDWHVRPKILISTTVRQISLTTNVPGVDYTSNQLSLAGRFNF